MPLEVTASTTISNFLQPQFCSQSFKILSYSRPSVLVSKPAEKRRLPRGFHGITSTLELYLETVNKKLAEELDFNPSDQLVRKVLEKIATQMVKADDRWLSRPKAGEIVNEVLPGRGFSQSLYRGLIDEGVLIEERETWKSGDSREEVVYISYDRFTDHIIADFSLAYPSRH